MFLLFYNLIGIELFLQVFLPPLYIYVALFLLSFSIFLSSPSFLCPPLRWCYRRSGERLVCIRECDACAYTTRSVPRHRRVNCSYDSVIPNRYRLCHHTIHHDATDSFHLHYVHISFSNYRHCSRYIFVSLSCLSLSSHAVYIRVSCMRRLSCSLKKLNKD